MFSQIHGLPVHPLAVHAAVVLVPLAALLGLLFVVPRTHAWARLPLVFVSLGSVASVYVARASGVQLRDRLDLQGVTADLINEHQARANQLFILVLIFAAVSVAAYVLTRAANPNRILTTVVSGLLVVGALAVAYQTYRVGDIGSQALWNPSGQVDYGSSGAASG